MQAVLQRLLEPDRVWPLSTGRGQLVAILGAGVSGLTAAYELDRAGYDVVILEAQRRAGGRSLTLRRGDVFQEMKQPAQTDVT